MLLQQRARRLGVDLRFETEIGSTAALAKDFDLVVAADGLNSRTRNEFAGRFKPAIASRVAPTSPDSALLNLVSTLPRSSVGLRSGRSRNAWACLRSEAAPNVAPRGKPSSVSANTRSWPTWLLS